MEMWKESIRMKLGNAIQLLYTGRAQDRRTAYIDYFEVRREVGIESFEEFMDRLEDHRIKAGAFSIRKRIDEIREELVKKGYPTDQPEEKEIGTTKMIFMVEDHEAPVVLPDKETEKMWIGPVEQMELFG